VHALAAVPTWRSCIGSRFAICDRVGEHAQSTTTADGHPLCRITCRITAHIIVRWRGIQGMRIPDRRRTAAQKAAARQDQFVSGDVYPQKLTRPDGEIRAGRVDRRRGSGGRERRSGL
jgi:hypothetical protein